MKAARPTSGRVLAALFNILGSIDGRSFLDLFAGTGRVGLEAARRGAEPVVWVEVLRDRAEAIKRSLPPGLDSLVLGLELRRALRLLAAKGASFDIIFADPPYLGNWGASLLKLKTLSALLKPEGLMILEHATREPLKTPPPWQVSDRRTYGETTLTFLNLSTSPVQAKEEDE
ncbi:MAG: DNA methyltransferase [Fretibacterium sp.]|nr:DNA methyltransferase [Fretibacterium sp.]